LPSPHDRAPRPSHSLSLHDALPISEGQQALREAISGRFGGAPDNVLVVAGAQQGLDLLARCLIEPGDAVVVDRPGYLGAIDSFRSEEHTSELQSLTNLVCRLLLEKN